MERIKSEDRKKEWDERIIAERKANPTENVLNILRRVRDEFGFRGDREEKKLYAERVAITKEATEAVFPKRETRYQTEKKSSADFSEALRNLPPSAPSNEEMAWIGRHPLLTERHRMRDKTVDLVVDAEAILNSVAGPAPSQFAANMLQHWVNNPSEYFKQVISEKKKAQEQEEKKEVKVNFTVSEIDAILNSLE